MKLTTEEKLMYDVMDSINNSGIPINFKGSMVLKACLLEAGYNEPIRHTVDIDANWHSDIPPTTEQIKDSFQKAIDKSNLNLKVESFRDYGENRSAGFNLIDNSTGEIIFKMDVDVNRPVPPTKLYEINGVQFRGVSPLQMIADKVSVVSSDKVFRRIKDVIDLYYFSKAFNFNVEDISQTLKNSGREIGEFDGFLSRTDDLKHSYEKFRFAGDIDKPPFEEIYSDVQTFIKDILPQDKFLNHSQSDKQEDKLTDIGEIGGDIPTNEDIGNACKEIMDSKEEFVYDEIDQSKSKDAR